MRRCTASLAVAILFVTGCSDSGPRLVPVTGTLFLDGTPLPHKTVAFFPAKGTQGLGAGATTDKDGKFTLLANKGGSLVDHEGIVAGKYKVVVTEPMFPIKDKKIPGGTGTEDEPVAAVGVPKLQRSPIPARYRNKKTSPLVIEVPDNGGTIDLKLVSTN